MIHSMFGIIGFPDSKSIMAKPQSFTLFLQENLSSFGGSRVVGHSCVLAHFKNISILAN